MTADLMNGPTQQQISDLADRLQGAARSRTACAPVRDVLGDDDVLGAYAVQRELTRRRLSSGATRVGRKIGLTSPAVQAQLKVDQPDFGVLFDDMNASEWPQIPAGRLLQPKAEAEVAFVLGMDLDSPDLTLETARAAIDHAVASIEIVDSRIADWDIRITDTVADAASSALFVLGDTSVGVDRFEPRDVRMRMFADGELVSEGTGADCLGDPVRSLLWLARTAQLLGDPLRAGEVVLTGSLGPVFPAVPGVTVRAEFSHLGTVSASFAPLDPGGRR